MWRSTPAFLKLLVYDARPALLVDVTDDEWRRTLRRRRLCGLQDRVEAYSGHLKVDSPAGHGTHIRAELPCA